MHCSCKHKTDIQTYFPDLCSIKQFPYFNILKYVNKINNIYKIVCEIYNCNVAFTKAVCCRDQYYANLYFFFNSQNALKFPETYLLKNLK